MRYIAFILLIYSLTSYSQDTIYFADSSWAVVFSDSINLANGYPRQEALRYQSVHYDTTNDIFYHLINKVSEKGLEESDSLWVPMMWTNVDDTLWYNETPYRTIQAHYTASHWTPDIVPALFLEISLEECPDWVQPAGAHDAYNIGDCVTFNGQEYESLINANVWSPAVYPAGWALK
jgi:hypothetical protein